MKFVDDFRDLDFQNLGSVPQSVKVVFCVALFGLILAVGWWFEVKSQQEELEQVTNKEMTLREEFKQKQAKVVNLDALQKQLKEMQDMLAQLIDQLPDKTDMPQLLVDISEAALAAGLETQLFQPGPESVKEFYAEKPIQLRMLGTYHQFGEFISRVAAMQKVVILAMHDVSLKPSADQKGAVGTGQLVLEGTVKTYNKNETSSDVSPATAKPAKPVANAGGK